jgi:phosphonate transport system permease protein
MVDFLSRMFPPDLSIWEMIVRRLIETIQIAILGTTFGVIGALALSFLAARNFMPNRFVHLSTRVILNACRGVSELVYALLFVAMVGLGAFPGVLALSIHTMGALGKYFSEAVENMEPEVLDAVRATGATRRQVAFQGILPELLPGFISYSLYYLEHNIRAATVLGLVGAGGIGIELLTSIKLFKYPEVLTMLLAMLLLITVVDCFSAALRKWVIV